MKKYILQTIILCAGVILFSACEESGEHFVEGPTNVGFNNYQDESVSEATPEIYEVELRTSRVLESPTTVSFDFTAVGLEEGVDFEFVSSNSEVVIPAEQSIGKILIKFIDNLDVSQEDRFIDFTLTNSGGEPQLGQELITGLTEKRLYVLEDDCPLDLSSFVGTYSALENNGDYGPYEMTIELNEAGDGLIINNLWDVAGSNSLSLDASDPANPFALFTDGEYLYTNPTYGDALVYNSPDYTATFSTCNNTLDLYFAVCVSVGCFTGFDGPNHRVEMTPI